MNGPVRVLLILVFATVGGLLVIGAAHLHVRRAARTAEIWAALNALSTPELVDRSKLDGDRIVTAILHYRAAHGRTPTTLNGLIPGYLPSIPAPSAGCSTWEYRWFGADEFSLSFGVDEHGSGYLYPKYYRSSDQEGWHSDF